MRFREFLNTLFVLSPLILILILCVIDLRCEAKGGNLESFQCKAKEVKK